MATTMVLRQRRAAVNVEYVLLMVIAALAVVLGVGFLSGVMNAKHISLADALWGKGIPTFSSVPLADAETFYRINHGGGSLTVWSDKTGKPTYQIIQNASDVMVNGSVEPSGTYMPMTGSFPVFVTDSAGNKSKPSDVTGFWGATLSDSISAATVDITADNNYGLPPFILSRDGAQVGTAMTAAMNTPLVAGNHTYVISDDYGIQSQPLVINGGVQDANIVYIINYGGTVTAWSDVEGQPEYTLIKDDLLPVVSSSPTNMMTMAKPLVGGFTLRILDSTPSSTKSVVVNGFWSADIHGVDKGDGTIRIYSNNPYGFSDFSLWRDGVEIANGASSPSFVTPYLLGVHVYEIRDAKAIESQQVNTNREPTMIVYGNNLTPDFSQVARGDGTIWLNGGTASVMTNIMSYSMSHAVALNQNTQFVVGARLAKTTNGGASWTNSALPFNPAYTMDNISVSADKSTLWMSGQLGYAYKSTDDGATWTNRSVGGAQGMFGVAGIDANIAYVAGGGGVINKTTNGGTTWVAQTSGTTNSLSAGAAAANANTVWVAGASGTIRKTTNGGATWVGQTSGTTNSLYKLAVVDANTAWVVGSGGVIRKTTNGGTTWVGQTSGTTNNLLDITAINANTAYAVGAAGTVLKTTDGGTTWTLVKIMKGIGVFGAWTKNLVAVTAF